MSVRSGGSLAMFLVTGSLVAIPLMAMFEVPPFASLSASTEPAADDFVRPPFADVVTENATTSSEPARGGMPPILSRSPQSHKRAPRPAPLTESSSFINDPPNMISRGRGASVNARAESTASPPNMISRRRGASVSPSRVPTSLIVPAEGHAEEHALAPSPAPVGSDPSWENAALRLQEMGIDDYRLERGHNGESYLFICQFAPGGDARIIQRFEAEAAEPFDAVQQVLTQIDDWRERTTSSTSQTR